MESWYFSLNLKFISAEKTEGQQINKYQDRAAKYGVNKKLCCGIFTRPKTDYIMDCTICKIAKNIDDTDTQADTD